MYGWSDIEVTNGDKCVTKAVSRQLDNFLTARSRAKDASIMSIKLEYMISLFRAQLK